MRLAVLLLLSVGFLLLFWEMDALNRIAEALKRTRSEMTAASRQRSLADRQNLMTLQEKHSRWHNLEQRLLYSGIRKKFPGVTAEWWLLGNLTAAALLFGAVSILGGVGRGCAVLLVCALTERFVLWELRRRNLRRTEENLMKLLEFLGNYSLASGEITSIFGQISRYVEEPVKSALDVCCYEAATTGDVSMALSAMAERIEHPKFKELVRNMEVSVRYCADFSVLVNSSRRSLREYLRMARERRGMLREAAINLGLLVAMSAVVLLIVGRLTEAGWAF